MRTQRARVLLWLAALTVAAACSDTTTEPLPPLEADGEIEAEVLATNGITDEQANGSSVLAASGSSKEQTNHTAFRKHDECKFDEASARFVCPDVHEGGLTYSRSFAFFDAAGNAQSKRDTNTVAMNTRIAVKGTVNRDGHVSKIDRSSDLTQSGIQRSSKRRTLNGVEQGTIEVVAQTSRGNWKSVGSHADSTINVVIPQNDSTVPKWPLSGTIIRVSSGTKSRAGSSESRSFSRREVLVFNGTSKVKVTITVNGVTRECERDLEKRESTCG